MRITDLENLFIGEVVNGKYLLRECLGSGGNGAVFRAEEVKKTLFGRVTHVGKAFAVKLVGIADEEEATQLLQRMRLTTTLNHSHILPCYEAGRVTLKSVDFLYLAMELAEANLRETLEKRGAFSEEEVLSLGLGLAEALAYTHTRPERIVHFDVKPSNVLRLAGSWRLIDFDIARSLGREGAIMTQTASGTDAYKAPERLLPNEENPLDTAYDLWSLGITLLEALGKIPIGGGSGLAMLAAMRREDPALPEGIPDSLREAIASCLVYDWRKRKTASEIAVMLGGEAAPEGGMVEGDDYVFESSSSKSSDDVQRCAKDGAEIIWIPEGTFLMGGKGHEREQPIHKVTLRFGFWMYKYPVTVAQYRQFCAVTGRRMPPPPSWGWRENHPMVNVSWEEAWEYSEWAGMMLPTEAQWEYAARGGLKGKAYPWGDKWDAKKCAHSVKPSYLEGTTAVGIYDANAYGLYDMAGNVCEWCLDWYGSYMQWDQVDPVGMVQSENMRILRGGSWAYTDPARFRCADRLKYIPENRSEFCGFRCVSHSLTASSLHISLGFGR